MEKIAKIFNLPLVVLRRYENFWEISQRLHHFPHRVMRNCTLYLKVRELNKWVIKNREKLGKEIVIVSGIRAEESRYRATLPEWREHETTLKNGSFTAKVWYPCLHLKEKEVYDIIKAEGLPLHPCYKFSQRCSCWCCIFQVNSVVREYAEMHPELYEHACLVEDEIKHKWKQDFGFNDLMART